LFIFHFIFCVIVLTVIKIRGFVFLATEVPPVLHLNVFGTDES